MKGVSFRTANEKDIPDLAEVFLVTLKDMYARRGVLEPLPPRDATESEFLHFHRTGTFRVAEKDGRIVSIGGAIVRDRLWYLSSFWTLPEYQQRRIGGRLLDALWSVGRKAGAKTFFTWSSSDPTAMAAYMRRGMLPGYQVLKFVGTSKELQTRLSGHEVSPLEKPVAMMIDKAIRGTSREEDHDFWLDQADSIGRAVLKGGEVVGYYYISGAGIGPMAWSDPGVAKAMMALAFRDALRNGRKEVAMAIPGTNHSAVRYALDSGLRLVGFAHLLTTNTFGIMEQYIPSGPGLF